LWAEQGEHRQRALGMTQFAVAAEPENIAYRDSLGWAYFQLGRYDEAVAELEKAAAEDDPDGVILDHLADAYHKQGQNDKALATWQRAAEAFEKEKDDAKLKSTRAKIAEHKK
jgi:tetratricopeptide (TPR) repeat protein